MRPSAVVAAVVLGLAFSHGVRGDAPPGTPVPLTEVAFMFGPAGLLLFLLLRLVYRGANSTAAA